MLKISDICNKISELDDFYGSKKLEPGDYYTTAEGYIVFTEQYHLKRGYCCKSGCRHCPYGFNKKTGKIESKTKKN